MRITLLALVAALMLAGCGSETTSRKNNPTADSASKANIYVDTVDVDDTTSDTGNGSIEILSLNSNPTTDSASEADIYVDPVYGDDAAFGTGSAPIKSLSRAQTLVRTIKALEPTRQTPIVVLLRGGTYTLTETLAFGTQDSGTAAAPVVYQAYPGETPVISGGVELSGWTVNEKGHWELTLSDVVNKGWVFTQLWSDGERRYRPRTTKDGYLYIKSKVAPLNTTNDNRFGFLIGDLDPTWHNLSDVEVLTTHWWTISRMRISEIDVPRATVTFTGQTSGVNSGLWTNYRYLVENVFESLSEEGEWYVDSVTGLLTYIPVPGEDPATTTIVVPLVQTLVNIEGNGLGDHVEYISFEGITFAHTHWATPAAGYSSYQAERDLSASAIELKYANYIQFKDCQIEHTGEYGIAIRDDSHNNTVEGCILSDLGAGGIRIGAMRYTDTESQVTSHNIIRDNLINAGGRLHPAGIGVFIQHAAHNTIEYNDISDFYYSGMSVGWSWGYDESNSHDNEIGYNHIENIGQKVLSDMGGIYTLGVSTGTRIHHNLIHDVSRVHYGGWGIYHDWGSSAITVDNNLVHSTQDSPFFLHGGQNVTLTNNILVSDRDFVGVLDRDYYPGDSTLTADHNIIVHSRAEMFSRVVGTDDNAFDYNLYWSTGGTPTFDFGSFSTWQAIPQDVNASVADPLFVDAANDDYTLDPGSPAFALDINAVNWSTFGRLSLPSTADLPLAARAFPAAVTSAPLDVNFESMNVGERPVLGTAHTGDGSGSLFVTSAKGALGTGRSLHFVDAADITQNYNPSYTLNTSNEKGTFHLGFSLQWHTNAVITVTMRDWSVNPYIVGPTLNVTSDGSLVVGGNTVTTLRDSQWVRLEMVVPLGGAADGTFTLTLTPEGSATQSFPALPSNAEFNRVTYIGFFSGATTAQKFFVDEISAHVE